MERPIFIDDKAESTFEVLTVNVLKNFNFVVKGSFVTVTQVSSMYKLS